MPTINGSVTGWRTRARKTWYPTNGSWKATSDSHSVSANASSPVVNGTSTSSNNKYTVCIRVTTPTNSAIETITALTISFYGYDRDSTSGTLYGSLRTVDPASGSTENDTLATYRTNVAGGSQEVGISPSTTRTQYSMTFNGTFAQGATYYLYLYSKDTNDQYTIGAHSSYFTCVCTYTTPSSYSVTYNANGHGTAPSSQTKKHNTNLTLQPFITNQTATGYTVSYNANGGSSTPNSSTSTITYTQTSWNTNSSGTGTSYSSSGTYSTNAALKLYAIWSSSNGSIKLASAISRTGSSTNYTIKYNANGGTSTPSNQILKRTTPYTFAGWRAGSTSGTLYSAGASYTPTANITMYASWTTGSTTGSVTLANGISKNSTTETGYTVTLNTNGGTCDTTSLTTTNTRSYTFKEWNTNSSGTGTAYSAGAKYSSNANLTLYAIFNSSISGSSSVSLPIPKKSGYIFLGWSTTNGSTSYVNQNYTPSKNITLYANYKQGYEIEMYLFNGGRWLNVLMT